MPLRSVQIWVFNRFRIYRAFRVIPLQQKQTDLAKAEAIGDFRSTPPEKRSLLLFVALEFMNLKHLNNTASW
jgi:hypothetical protein